MYINYEIYFKKTAGKIIQCLTNVADRSIMVTNKNIIKKHKLWKKFTESYLIHFFILNLKLIFSLSLIIKYIVNIKIEVSVKEIIIMLFLNNKADRINTVKFKILNEKE